jgi:hypothetical protein
MAAYPLWWIAERNVMVCLGPFDTGKERDGPNVDGEVVQEPARGSWNPT